MAVAFSGGRDSACLLHALHALHDLRASNPFDLRAVHVHHGLSPHADAWADQCVDFCRSLGVPLEVERVGVDRQSGQGLEAAARAARYQVLARLPVDVVVLAHHRDDQAETLLLNLLRGAGVHGAAGMTPERRQLGQDTSHAVLLRPFLQVPRADIEAYVALHRLPFVEDESNVDTHFRRNFLRHKVIPLLRERFPSADAQLAAAAERFADSAALLDELAVIDLAAVGRPGGLDCRALANLSTARQRNLLRCWLGDNGEQVASADQIDEVLRQAKSLRADVEARIPLAAHDLHVWRGLLRLDEKAAVAPVGSLAWRGEPELSWAGGIVRFVEQPGVGLRLAGLPPLELRQRHGGETLRIQAQGPRRPVKKLLQEHAVPPWQRLRLPFVWGRDELLCVPGLGVAAAYAAQPGEPGLRIEWLAESD